MRSRATYAPGPLAQGFFAERQVAESGDLSPAVETGRRAGRPTIMPEYQRAPAFRIAPGQIPTTAKVVPCAQNAELILRSRPG